MIFRDRIKDLRRVKAGDLRPHPKNWRAHPDGQRSALTAVLAEVGWADALIAREKDGGLELIDGHLRADLDPEAQVPVLVVDLDDGEADKLLLTLDPLAALAMANPVNLAALAESTSFLAPELEALKRSLFALPTAPVLGPILDESLAAGMSICLCQACGHEHHRRG